MATFVDRVVLHATGVEDERVVVVRELGGGQVRPRVELGTARRGREVQAWARAVGTFEQRLAHAVVEVADRVAAR